MIQWDNDLKIQETDLYLDSRSPRAICFISHAHSDHIAPHARSLATPATIELSAHRLQNAEPSIYTPIPFQTPYSLDPQTTLTLLPAGHVLGSAMLRIQRPQGSLLYTGDFTLQRSLTAEPAEICQADHLVMESTYGLPIFRFPPRELVAEQLHDLVESAFRAGRQPIVMGYSLGKSQEITRILTDAGHAVTLHGAPHSLANIYQRHGIQLGTYRRYAYEDFHGHHPLDLRQRGVLVAPPRVARTSFVSRFNNPLTIMMTGWALLKGANFRYGVHHCLPFSDHADFSQLLQTIERVHPKQIHTHHGYRKEFAEHLRQLGHDARIAEPDGQMMLFE